MPAKMNPEERRVMFGVSMPPAIYNELDKTARAWNLSRSQIITLAVKAFLVEENKRTAEYSKGE